MEGTGPRAQGPDEIDLAIGEDRRKYAGSAAQSFRELIAWQKAMDLAVDVYALVRGWPRSDQFGLGSQLQRAASSAAANIAEGFERRSTKEYLRFLAIASGSVAETETHLILAQRTGIGDDRICAELQARAREVGRILRGIERGLGRHPKSSPNFQSSAPDRDG